MHQEQDVEGHRGSAGHRRQLLWRLHAQEALRQEPPALRVPVRPRRHRPATAPPADGAGLGQEEEGGHASPAAARALAGLAGLQGLLLRAELRERRGRGRLVSGRPAAGAAGAAPIWRAAGCVSPGLPQQRPVSVGSPGSERLARRRAAQAAGSTFR